MPSTWLTIDSDFPTFSKETPVTQQVTELQDYMVRLIEQLRYQLTNLNTDNWNDAAMKRFQEDTTSDVVEEMVKIAQQFTQLSSAVQSLTGRVAGLESRTMQIETDVGWIQQEQEEQSRKLEELEEQLTDTQILADELAEEQAQHQTRIGNAEDRLEVLEDTVKRTDTEVTIGDGKRSVRLVGEIYINGVKLEVGG